KSKRCKSLPSEEDLTKNRLLSASNSDFRCLLPTKRETHKNSVITGYSFRLRYQHATSETSVKKVESLSSIFSDLTPELAAILQDEFILQELLEMRILLDQMALRRYSTSLFNLLVTRPAETGESKEQSNSVDVPPEEPIPHFPVGLFQQDECGVCWEHVWLYRRPCCSFAVCANCCSNYYEYKVRMAIVSIECINPKCHEYVHRDEISVRLSSEMKCIYYRLLSADNCDETSKTCPKCNRVHRLQSVADLKEMKSKAKTNFNVSSLKVKSICLMKYLETYVYRVQCAECECVWCFLCHSPWHNGITCKQFRKGDRLLKFWAKQISHGQVNAQRCPKCKTYIQRSSGCDHMHCTRCETNFCYRCGDKLRRLKFFGDHYSKLSIFGCKYRYKAESPVQRKIIRGAVFGSKVMLAPVLGSLVACAGILVCGVAVVALPLYGGIRLYRNIQRNKVLQREMETMFEGVDPEFSPKQFTE
ncbi:uncharacterized protein B4U80_10661, partial [Leptotrombidium deliense]